MAKQHAWTFFRAGGFDQVKLETAADLEHLESLDQKLWVALACPTTGLELEPRTLALIDSDKDGRVRAPELLSAVRFATSNLKRPEDLLKGAKELALSAIADSTPEGKVLLASAQQILANLGKPQATAIAPEDFADPARIFADTVFNGDGVITEAAGEDDETRAVIREIADTMGTVPDRSGAVGVSVAKVEAFFEALKSVSDWQASGEADAQRVFPLGPEKTELAAAAVAKIRSKVDDYFGRCRLAAFDPRTAQLLNRNEEAYAEIAARDLSLSVDEVAAFPLAHIGADRPLPLGRSLNPAHVAAMKALRDDAIVPLLGARAELSEADWLALLERLSAHNAWLAAKPAVPIDKLGTKRIREIAASDAKKRIFGLLEKDQALEAEAASIENVERLARYNRDLFLLCTNFVNFKDFYDGNEPAVFQSGTLYLDQRACRLCLKVEDTAKHASMAGLAGAYLAYLDCVRKGSDEKMHIVSVFTAGDSDNLMVGRNGIFYDRQGRDWDATITKIVESPISLRQAFWSPYKKLARLIEEQIAKRAAAADADSHKSLESAASTAANIDKAKPEPAKIDVGSVAALGVAVGAIGTFFTAFVGYLTGILKLGVFATVGAGVGLLLLISTPSVVLAHMKLRKRNLGPILDANGWAVNANARVNVPFGATLTSVAKLPKGARRESDRYVEKGLPWKRWVFLFLVVYLAYDWYKGSFNHMLPEAVRPAAVLGKFAPEPEPAPTPAAAPAPTPKP